MAYNYKSVESFIKKVNKEAEEAAQKVFDKYNNEFLKRVQNQIKENDTVWIGMGTASIENMHAEEVGEKLKVVIGQSQYWRENISAGLSLPYKFNKHTIIKK